jgi:hypothetical protein
MPFVLWNVSKQSFPNNALYSSKEEAEEYSSRIQAAQALQVEEADEVVAVDLPGPVARRPTCEGSA